MADGLTRKLIGPNNWGIFHAGVQVGQIYQRELSGNVTDWYWKVGFYPPIHPSRYIEGSTDTLDEARAEFEATWPAFLATVTEAELQEWRDATEFTRRKYELWDRGEQLPPNEYAPGKPASTWMECACGVVFNTRDPAEVQIHSPHIEAAKRMKKGL